MKAVVERDETQKYFWNASVFHWPYI
jgi:hypothetical protein